MATKRMRKNMEMASGEIAWRSPSNIALVKYWGKKPVQIPANPSLSMTLSKALTEMTMEFMLKEKAGSGPQVNLWFEGKKNEYFEKKIRLYVQSLSREFTILNDYQFNLSSRNTFPHSTGIASSASSMSALGLCLAEFLARHRGEDISLRQASGLARLASGSACRSVYGGFTVWGYASMIENTSDEYAIPVPFEISQPFRQLRDAILVVSSREKKVSSRAGHSMMEQHPYAPARYRMAIDNIADLSQALKSGDIEQFIHITESEALNLHAMMMTSPQSYVLFESGTLHIMNAIRQFRKANNIPVCFTLDAGPNVHMLYPAENEIIIKNWINRELIEFCEEGKWIDDEIGIGPEKIVQHTK